ncbi:hypothetical protein [Gordonia tangerina]|uniref:Uncharacterized protein n=1 Tax=Gordonia tangerina TaxID=2911060 RepID=A0ABS9DNW1_9ACTN|nr:hypothetical protein [Gordonia tangerina]MCF3939915.1 hypothetical protein [Gordonia tangerina]
MLADIEKYGLDGWLNIMITLYGDAAFDGTLRRYGYEPIDDILAPFYAGIPVNAVLEKPCGDTINTD